jgi:Baseplate J-like protein
MPRYIQLPIQTNSVNLLELATNYLANRIPGWRVQEAELDYIMLQTQAMLAAELATIASDVPAAIFRYFGSTLMDMPPEEATVASTSSTWTAIDDAGYAVPIGTTVGIPSADGSFVAFTTANEVIIPPGSTSTAIGEVILTASEAGAAGSGLGNEGTVVQLVDPLDWVDTIILAGMTIGGVDEELDDVYLDRLRAELQLMSPRPILPQDFAVLARERPGVFRATAIDMYNPQHNLLTANEASIETDITGWTAYGGCTVARSTSQAADGAASAQITSTGSGNMQVRLTTAKPASFAQRWTGGMSFRSAATARSCRAQLEFLNAGGGVIGTASLGTSVTDSTSGWIAATVSAIAPEGTATVRLVAQIIATSPSEIHYFDKAFLRKGQTDTTWTPGDSGEFQVERQVAVALQDSLGGAASPTVKADVRAFLDEMREVNFVVNVIDPTFTTINVVWEVQSVPGTNLPALLDSVNQALSDYLNPTTWGLPEDRDPRVWINRTKVRYTDLVHIVKDVVGVDYIVNLVFAIAGGTLGTTDITLPGVAPLPLVGALNGTVN